MTTNRLRFRCTQCQARIQAPFRLCGQSRPCPSCRRPVTVPRAIPEPCGAVLVLVEEDDRYAWRLRPQQASRQTA
jgi:hypothetical protein